ncbi:N-acetyltransferase family protein [Sediminibacillus sp. JSM 1682029]|uniref:GNAT family N-acetyltransferase n=1 Tax=Sediminibacillus sp. JSM 1682029 TaxID=3229857 RepID=UPI003523DC4E
MHIRNVRSQDYEKISPLINQWWGGRNMEEKLPKLFFVHFQPTSFIVEEDGVIIAFLIGFLSQTNTEEAYIHFVGVDPEYRNRHIGTQLYERFFQTASSYDRSVIKAVTSPINKASIAYHTRLGFAVETGDKQIDGIDIHSNYDGNKKDRVLFCKKLRQSR